MLFILDRKGHIVGVLNTDGDISKITPFFRDTHTEELETGAEILEFETLGGTEEAYYLQVGNFIAFKDEVDGFKLFEIREVDEEHTTQLIKKVYCEGSCLELLNDYVRPMSIPSCNIRQFLESILSDTSWSVGMIDIGLQNSFSVDISDYPSVYKAIQDTAIGKFNAEIRFRVDIQNNRIVAKYVDAFLHRGRVTKHRFEYGGNTTKVSRKIDTTELATALIGIGKNNITFKDAQAEDKPLNQDFIVSQEAYDRWNVNGKHILGVHKEDTDSPEELLKLTRKALKTRGVPKITYDLSVELLGDDVRLGDEVFVIDTEFNPPLLLSARVSVLEKTKTNGNPKCTLSNFREVRSNITDDMRALANELEGKLDDKLNSKFPVGTDDIKDDAVTSDKIGQNQIYGSHIYADQIDTQHLKADSVTADKIQAKAINSDKLDAKSITTEHLTANLISGTEAYIDNGYIKSAMIGDGEIQTANIGTAVIESAHIKNGQIDTIHITDGAIDTAKIQDASINSAKIQALAVENGHIKDLSADKIVSGTIDASKITVTNLSASNITTGTLDATKITVTGLSADSIISGTIDATKITVKGLSASSITTGILDASKVNVTNLNASNIVSGSIDASKISVTNLSASSITTGTLDATKIVVKGLSADSITSGIIDASKISVINLNASNITTGKIQASMIEGLSLEVADASITTAKIKDLAVTGAKIQVGSIGTAHIVDGSISSAKIGKAQITDANIADATITSAKIKELNASKITSGTVDTSKIMLSGINGKLKIVNNRLQVFDAQATPVERVSIGDVNNDGSLYGLRVRGKDGKTVLYDENGVYSEGITDGAITNPKISNESISANKLMLDDIFADTGFIGALKTISIDADQITTGKISGDRIDLLGLVSFEAMDSNLKNNFVYDSNSGKTFINGDSIFTKSVTADKIDARGLSVKNKNNIVTFNISDEGDATITGTIKSTNYSDVVGSESGYKLTPDGDAILNNAIVRGSVILPKSGITDANITGVDISKNVRFWSGADFANRANAPFRVLDDGTVISTKGIFNGTVTGAIDIGNIKIEDTNDSNGSITIHNNDNKAEIIKLNEDLSFVDTNLIVGNINNKMVEFDKSNKKMNVNAPLNINNNGTTVAVADGTYGVSIIHSANGTGEHSQKYYQGTYVFDSKGTQSGADYQFEKNGATADVEVNIVGNLQVKNKITINNKIEMMSREDGFDFIIK